MKINGILKTVLIFKLGLITQLTFASDLDHQMVAIPYDGQVISQCHNHGFSGYSYTFDFVYKNSTLTAKDQVWLDYGFYGHGSINQEPFAEEIIWKDPELRQMQPSSPGVYKIQVKEFYLATGGYLDQLKFSIKIKSGHDTDSHLVMMNEAKPQYSVRFFKMGILECFQLTNPYALEVEAARDSNYL